jgi:hypothetical protein
VCFHREQSGNHLSVPINKHSWYKQANDIPVYSGQNVLEALCKKQYAVKCDDLYLTYMYCLLN